MVGEPVDGGKGVFWVWGVVVVVGRIVVVWTGHSWAGYVI